METTTSILCLPILFAALYYYVFCKIIPRRRRPRVVYQLPPGSTGWPIIGETLEYLRTAKNGVPEKFVADRRNKYDAKVFKTSLLGESMAVLCTAAGNKVLFANENKLVKSWWPAHIEKLFVNSHKTNTSQETIRMRKVISPFLKPDALRKYTETMDQVTKCHFDTHWSSSPGHQNQVVKVQSLAHKYTFTLSCKLFLNIEDLQVIAKLEEPIRHISAGLVSLPVDLPGTNFNRAIRASKQIKKEIESMVVQRKIDLMNLNLIDPRAPQDLMSTLLMERYSDGEEMTEADIANKLCGLLLGAYDTIIVTLCSIIMFLSQLPQVYDAVLKEQMEIANSKAAGELLNWGDIQKMKYTWNVACEVLRLQPPNSGFFREAITDFVYEGYLIPKGMKLHWNVFATHKNPEYFPEPEKFDPSRFEGKGPPPFSYVPFGGGPRMCPGNEYARLKILVFMHNLVTRFKWEKVFPDEKMVMDPIPVPTKGLPIRLYPHNWPP